MIKFTIVFVFFSLPSFAQIKNFTPFDCKNYKHEELLLFKFAEAKAVFKQSWIAASLNKKKMELTTEYHCQNKQTRKIKYHYGQESSSTSSAIAEVRCNKSFAIQRVSYPMGEGYRNDYIDLKTCQELGFGNTESFSHDGKYGVLISDADVEAGYNPDTGSLYVLYCDKNSCVQKGKKLFKEMGFSDVKWEKSNILTFKTVNLRTSLNPDIKPQSQVCTITFNPSDYKIDCE